MTTQISAMPQLIPQDNLNLKYVNSWRRVAEKALIQKPNLKQYTVEGYPLYHFEKNAHTGVWFISLDRKAVDYIYAYQKIQIKGKPHASEALAYLWNDDVRGVTKPIFFDFMLPRYQFIVTDSVYTPDGYRWFKAQYNHAFSRSDLTVYAIQVKTGEVIEVTDKAAFNKIQDLYWGTSEAQQHYRFAISY